MKRLDLIDTLRGLAVISMILYHACWIMNHFGILISEEMLNGPAFFAWERSICIPFIVIAGFSFSLGHNHLKSGLVLSVIGAAITALTWLIVPEIRIVFGILTFLGIATLIMIPVERLFNRISKGSRKFYFIAFVVSLFLFLATYNINKGYLGFMPGCAFNMPKELYKGYFATFLGFLEPGFYSSDYFSVFPWIFLYMCGYFLYKITIGAGLQSRIFSYGIPGVRVIGRHSLPIYLIHPIVLYLIFYMVAQNVLY